MPRDVVLGEGYESGEMVTQAYPAQHVGHYTVQDGAHSLLQRESLSGPPHGGHHHHGGGRGRGFGPYGWGPGYYEPLYVESVVLDTDDDSDEAKIKKLKAKLKLQKLQEEAKAKGISGLSGEEIAECVNRIINAAALGAREAIKGVESGVLKDLNDVCAHIRRRVCAEVQTHHTMYAKAVSQAIQSAFAEAKPHVEAMLSKGARPLSGLDGPISSQADYNLLSQVQVRANAIMAEISGIGKDEWDAIKNEEFEAAEWSPADNYSYDNMMAFWLNNIKSIILTPSKKPTTEQINEVNRLAVGTEKLIALVKSHATPSAVAQANQDRAQTEAMLSKGGYKSPSAVGWDTFQQEVVKRAESLVSTGIGVTTIVAIALGLGGAIYLWGRSR